VINLLSGWTPYVLPVLWIVCGFWGWIAHSMYFAGKWRRWTIRYSVIACIVFNWTILFLFCAMRALGDYIGDWDDKSTIGIIIVLACISIYFMGVLIANWVTPVRINQPLAEETESV
jgi:hypothetical protein